MQKKKSGSKAQGENVMGDFKGMADKRKFKENKYVMEAGKLKIGKGMISYDENILIPLSAISLVEIPEQEKNGQDVHELKIQNHAGTCFYITASDLDFIREVRSALMICMNDKNAVYSGTERVVVNEENKIYGDKIAAAGEIHIDRNRHSGAAASGNRSTSSAAAITILDDEWKTLEDYALKRMKDFSQKERNYTICEALAKSAELKNREKCKRILEVSGNNALDMIISGAPIAVKAIINKLM
ncbi:MAG: hypothetical protein K2J99_16375 [Lachnospiraceae bacterium]|nr:hypothetical protein [Lachnospiraceae bacterium]